MTGGAGFINNHIVNALMISARFLSTQKPKQGRGQWLKKVLLWSIVILTVSAISFKAGMIYVQSNEIAIDKGSFQIGASYVIFKDGDVIKARDQWGNIAYTGTDASEVIQSAINALRSRGGEIYITKGTYLIKKPLIPCSHLHIVGEDVDATALKLGADVNLFEYNASDRIYFFLLERITLNGDAPRRKSGNLVSFNDKVWDYGFYDVFFQNAPGSAIVGYGWNTRIIDCVFEWNRGDSALNITSGNDVRIVSNKFLDNYQNAITLGAGASVVMNNYIERSRYNGLILPSNIHSIEVIGNTFATSGYLNEGLYDNICTHASRVKIIGNNFRGDYGGVLYTRHGVYVCSEAHDTIIESNSFMNHAQEAILDVGTNTKIKNNVGFATENFKATGVSVAMGTSNAYASATAIKSLSGVITYPRVKITWGGTFGTGEIVTVKVESVYSDGTSTYVEKSATAVGSLWLTDDDILSLITQGKDIVKLNIYAKTNLASTTATVTVDAYGKA